LVDELLPLAIERGVSGFTLVSDVPRTTERDGREVAPALREALARERRPVASGSAVDGLATSVVIG
jgi:hypothetical protein